MFKSPVCCTFPTGQCYASANLPWASVSGTAVAQVFSLSVRGKTGILRWWYDCLNLLWLTPVPSSPLTLHSQPALLGSCFFSVLNRWRDGQWSAPRERKNSTQLKGFLLTYPSLLPSPPPFCVVVNPYRDTQLRSISLGEPHHLSDSFSDTSSSFFLLWLCRGKAE